MVDITDCDRNWVVVAGDVRQSVLSREWVSHHDREGRRVATEERVRDGADRRVNGALGLEGVKKALGFSS
jgi:hypothetical protein